MDIMRTNHRTRRMVHGIATTPTITSNNHSRSSAGCKIEFPIPLLCQHENEGSIGEIVYLRRSPREIYVIAALHDDNDGSDLAWSLVEQGEMRGLSVASVAGTCTVASSVMGTKFFGSWQLSEVSICRSPANPDCHFEIFSSRRKIP
jgi:phage head maturation protease